MVVAAVLFKGMVRAALFSRGRMYNSVLRISSRLRLASSEIRIPV